LRSDRAAIEFRGLPPAARDELKANLGDRIAVQESDWDCGDNVSADREILVESPRLCEQSVHWRGTRTIRP
jgi:hypothetical protein